MLFQSLHSPSAATASPSAGASDVDVEEEVDDSVLDVVDSVVVEVVDDSSWQWTPMKNRVAEAKRTLDLDKFIFVCLNAVLKKTVKNRLAGVIFSFPSRALIYCNLPWAERNAMRFFFILFAFSHIIQNLELKILSG